LHQQNHHKSEVVVSDLALVLIPQEKPCCVLTDVDVDDKEEEEDKRIFQRVTCKTRLTINWAATKIK